MRRLLVTTTVWRVALGALGACGSEDIEGDASGECEDGADNDRDGLFDCDDPNCSGAPACNGSQGGGGTGGEGSGGAASSYKRIAAAGVHNCGVLANDNVACWGSDAQGQSPPRRGASPTYASASTTPAGSGPTAPSAAGAAREIRTTPSATCPRISPR